MGKDGNIRNGSFRKTLIAAVVSSLLLLIFSYLFSHISLPMSATEYDVLKHAEQLQLKTDTAWQKTKTDSALFNSVLLINTSFDFDTIPYYDYSQDTTRYDIPEGYSTISRRMDIYRVLQAFSRDTTSYRYILLDVGLDSLPKNHSAYVDSLIMYTDSLVDLIVSMPRICVAQSSTFELVSERLKAKSGMVDYDVSANVSSFVKYNLIQDSLPSLPLRIYNELSGRTIEKHCGGLWYSDGCCLCRKNIIPTFPFRYKTSTYGWDIIERDSTIDTLYYRMDTHFNLRFFREIYADNDIVKEQGADKIVVIGDLFMHDIHTTYAGPMSGAIINLNTTINLLQEKHIIRGWFVCLLFIFYIGMFLFVIYCEKWWYKIPFWQRFWQADITQLVISFVSWTLIFHGIAILLYRYGIFYNIWLPIVWFTLIAKIYKLIIQPKYEK